MPAGTAVAVPAAASSTSLAAVDTSAAPVVEVTAAPTPSTAEPPREPVIVPPAAIVLPSGSLAAIVPVGVLPTGELQIPDDPTTVGWWSGGAALGDPTGNLVLAGHVDSRRYGLGVFRQLLQVEPGEIIALVDALGTRHEFRVTAREQLPKGDLPAELFDPGAPAGLVLFTCAGRFDTRTRHYSDNVIVHATPVVVEPVAL